MELLIPGLILVGLMIYVSTRIKKSAAKAFEAETIETDEFVIQKPEGFLHNLNAQPGNIFESYSKNFSKEHPETRIGIACIKRIEGRTVDDVAEEELSTGDSGDDFTEVLGDRSYRVFEIHRVNDGIATEAFYKLTGTDRGVYKLEVKALAANSGDQWVETFIDSFRVK